MIARRNPPNVSRWYPNNRGVFYSPAIRTGAVATAAPYLWKAAKSIYNRRYPTTVARRSAPVKRLLRRTPYKKTARLSKINKVLKTFMGNLEYRNIDSRYVRTAGYNQTAHSSCDVVDMAAYETILGQLRFFNPSVPGTLITASGASGTYYREYLFKSVTSTHVAKNNYQIPCKVTLYYCVPKEDTNINPITAFTNGITDGSNATATSLFISLKDSDEFNDLWKVAKSKSRTLQPGKQLSLSYSIKNMLYSPATYDSHTSTYQKRFKCFYVICRVEGITAHDSAANEVGFTNAGVDVTWRTSYKVQYDAGGDINYLYVSENQDSFTNGPLVSSMPVADNINFSIT